MTIRTTAVFVMAFAASAALAQNRMSLLMEAVRPVLPFPRSTAAGDLPADNRAESRWFVVWPAAADDARIIVRANPLHPEVQKESAAAMQDINLAVATAERRARESYERALERLRDTGKAGEIEAIGLDDEGIAGERIDADLEVAIEFGDSAVAEMQTGEAPTVRPGTNGASWVVSVPPNAYRSATDGREHFCAAQAIVYIGVTSRPEVTRVGNEPRYRITVPGLKAGHSAAATGPIAVVIRGNASLVSALTTEAAWTRLVSP